MSEPRGLSGTSARNRRLLYLLLALALAVILPALYVKATAFDHLAGLDFRLVYAASGRLLRHQQLYVFEPHGITYVYPPIVAMLLMPLAALPFRVALHLWAIMNVALVVISVGLFLKAARHSRNDRILFAALAIFSLKFWPTDMTIWFGQTNCILLVILAGIYWADSWQRPVTMGLLIGGAACIKIWMLGLLLLPLYRREWRAAVAAVALFTAVVAGSFTLAGWDEWPLFQTIIRGYAAQQLGQHYGTRSFIGFARVHFSHNSALNPIIASPGIRAFIIVSGFTMMGAGWLMLFLRRVREEHAGPASGDAPLARQLETGLAMITLLLALPMCETHYYMLCLPLFWTWAAMHRSLRKPMLPWLIGMALVFALYCRDWPAPQSGLGSLIASAEFFGGVLLWLLTFSALAWGPHATLSSELSPEVSAESLLSAVEP